MRRRAFLSLIGGAAAWPIAARAQQAGTPFRIGLLWPGDAPPVTPRMESFRQGLRALGFVDGQYTVIELRYAQKGPQQLPELAAELMRLKVDVIFAAGDLAPKVAQQATETIPIVAISDDILGAGVIASLSRPGGNTRRGDRINLADVRDQVGRQGCGSAAGLSQNSASANPFWRCNRLCSLFFSECEGREPDTRSAHLIYKTARKRGREVWLALAAYACLRRGLSGLALAVSVRALVGHRLVSRAALL